MAFRTESSDTRRIGTNLSEINIIPLVDVVLVLLLIFMLTAPMMYRGIDVNLPKAASKPTAVEERMVLTVTKDQALFLNEKRVPPTGLEATLPSTFANRNDKTLYLKAHSALWRRRGSGNDGPRPPRGHRAARDGHRAGSGALRPRRQCQPELSGCTSTSDRRWGESACRWGRGSSPRY